MGVDRHDARSVRRSGASPSQDLSSLSDDDHSASDRVDDRRDDGESRSIWAQIAVWLGVTCGTVAAYFLLFPIVAFWLFRISLSRSAPFSSTFHETLETLCTPLEWLQERLPWYDIYLSWLMDRLIG